MKNSISQNLISQIERDASKAVKGTKFDISKFKVKWGNPIKQLSSFFTDTPIAKDMLESMEKERGKIDYEKRTNNY